MKRLILAILLVAAIGGAGYAYTRIYPRTVSNPYQGFPREAVQRGPFLVTIEELGLLTAEKEVFIHPPYEARIVKLIDDGSMVKEGDPVCWMDTEEAKDSLEEHITRLRNVKADLERQVEDIRMGLEGDFLDLQDAAAQLEFNQLKLTDVNRDLMNLEAMQDSQLATESDLDKARMSVESGKLDAVTSDLAYQGQYTNRESQKTIKSMALDGLEYQRDKALGDIAEEQSRLDSAIVRAPISGIFLLKRSWDWDHHGHGQVSVGSKMDEDEIIGSVPDLTTLVIQSQIPESSVLQVKPGTKVNVTMDAFPDLQMTGQVSNIGMIAIERERSAAGSLVNTTDISGLKVFEVKITLDKIDERLRPSMTANCSIIVSQKDNVVSIPLRCAFHKGGQKIAYVATKSGYEARPIVLGARSRNSVIVQKGLKEGEQVFSIDLEPSPTEKRQTEPETASVSAPPPMGGPPGGGPPGGGGGPGGGGKRR
ncbi:MAG: HlyD family efflux transporter periplasmic adaptor subunit [Candidatus Sumerlaeota bacterium]|nr:HlyD family efflux transporter periplasmic adaptor subunit [Candidatus Sumerlaeota bacterium]